MDYGALLGVELLIKLTGTRAELLLYFGVAPESIGGFAGVDVLDGPGEVALEAVQDALGLAVLAEGGQGEILRLTAMEVLRDEGKGDLVAHAFLVGFLLHGGDAGLPFEGRELVGFPGLVKAVGG